MRPLHMAANLLWDCQLRCSICWIDALGIDRAIQTRPWQAWRDALCRFGQHLLVDFSGGEPLLFPGFHRLCLAVSSAGVEWAVTTNMLELDVVQQFLEFPVQGCVSWNMSYHEALTSEALAAGRKLREAGYPVAINAVLHPTEPLPSAKDLDGFILNWLPYQPWEGAGVDGVPRICDAGRHHCVIAPDGTAYRCQVEMQKRCQPMGNFLEGQFSVPPSTHLCLIGCSSCYTQNGQAAASWRVAMEVAE